MSDRVSTVKFGRTKINSTSGFLKDPAPKVGSQAGGSPPCVNGDIAIQWSNLDPSQNQNPLTDYYKTLQNW